MSRAYDHIGFPDPVQTIANAVASSGVDAEIIEPGAETPTVIAAAAALGVETGAIIKSVLFVSRGGECVLAIAAGTDRIDRKALQVVTSLRKLRLAQPEEVLEVTGFEAGGVPPIAHKAHIPVVVDESVLNRSSVYGGAGTDSHLLKISPNDIVRLTGATIAPITSKKQAEVGR